MKQNIVALVAFLFLGFAAQAQVSVGIKGGLNLANLKYKTDVDSFNFDTKNVTGLIAGAVFEFGLSEHFAIQAEANFIQKGALQDITLNGFRSKSTIRFDYLEVPVLAKVSIGGKNLGAYALAGPNFSYGLSGKSTTEFSGPGVDPTKEEDKLNWKDDEIKRTDVGLNLGVGIQFGVGGVRLFVDGRYNIGFSDLDDGDNNGSDSITHRGTSISAGVLFAL